MDNVRHAALKILYEIDVNKAYMNILINKVCALQSFDRRDAAFLNELVRGTVRNRLYIDYVISCYSSVKLKKISPWIINILRLGVYQLKFTDKIPESAAVNECVSLAKKYGHASSKGFVNAVLRKIASEDLGKLKLPEDKIKNKSVVYSYPEWMTQKLYDNFGETAEQIMQKGNEPPQIHIRANTLKISPEELEKRLSYCVTGQNGSMLHIKPGTAVDKLPEFKEGLFTVQSEPFNKTAELLEPCEGMTVIDACAAPGGKTTHIAELMKNRGRVYAFDIYEHKLRLIDEAAARLGIDIIETRLHDASTPVDGLLCDRLLLDVPCSALGIIRRRPDIKWNREQEDFAGLQRKILESMSRCLKPGGIMVYSTCSIDRAENENVVCDFLKSHSDFYTIEFLGAPSGMKTYLPGEDDGDGAFICKMGRK